MMLSIALEYISRGWKPIPVPYKSKAPVLGAWQKLRITEADAERYFCGKTNVGVLLGEPSRWLIDIDLDNPLAVELAEKYLPATGAIFGRAGKPASHWLYYAICPVDTYKRSNRKIKSKNSHDRTIAEMRSTGVQTIFPGSVHESGELIEWSLNGEPTRIDPGELMVMFDELCDEVERRLGVYAKEVIVELGTQPITVSGWCGNGDDTIGNEFNKNADVSALLTNYGWTLVADKGDCTHWRRPDKPHGISASLRKSDQTFVCFTSSTDFKDWESCKEGYSPFAVLAILAHGGDFKKAAQFLYEQKELTLPFVDISGLLKDKIKIEPIQEKPKQKRVEETLFPRSVLSADGIIGQFVAYAVATAPRPQPELCLASAVALVGTLAGRKIRSRSNMRTNIYMVSLAPSGSGKEWPRKCVQGVLAAASADNLLAPENPASDAGLISSLNEQPASLFQIDEINRYFATIRAAGDKTSHLSGIFSMLMKLEGQASNPAWKPKGYGKKEDNKTIAYPHCCMNGTGTPEGFWSSVKSSDATDGFLARLCVIEAGREYPRLRDTEYSLPPGELIKLVERWSMFEPPGGNLASINPEALIVPFDSTATERINGHAESIEDRIPGEPDEVRAVWGRASATAKKLAMIFAASRGPDGIIVTRQDADHAVAISNWCTRLLLRRVFTHVAENEAESKKKRTLEIIRKHSPIKWRDLTRKTQGWIKDDTERKAILGELTQAEYIRYDPPEDATGGKKGTFVIIEE